MKKASVIVWLCGVLWATPTLAQELLATVNIDAEQVQSQEKQVFEDLKNNIKQFLNNRRWTTDKFGVSEKIKININIRLDKMSPNRVEAKAMIQVSRPVYGVGYESPLLSFFDQDFNFDYTQNQTIEFNEQSYIGNLSSLLMFYAYLALAFDYDSFGKLGGNAFFEKAQLIMTNAQGGAEEGWKQFDNNPNSRYWLMDNIMSPQFKEFREAIYVYHRLGFDVLASNAEDGRAKIMQAIGMVKRTHDVRPNSCMLRTFFNTKDNEIINVLSEASSGDRAAMAELLSTMDPTSTEKYEKLTK